MFERMVFNDSNMVEAAVVAYQSSLPLMAESGLYRSYPPSPL